MADEHKLSAALQAQADAASVAKDIAGARKAVADASAAEQAAALGALKAKIGEPAAGPFGGSAEIGDDTGLAEINHLAREGLARLADTIAAAIVSAAGDDATVLLTSSEAFPQLGHADALKARLALVEEAVAGAKDLSDAAMERERPASPSRTTGGTGPALVAPLAVAGLILGGVNALLGFARSDYKFGGTALTPSDRSLLLAVAKRLRTDTRNVLIDGYLPPADDAQRAALNTLLRKASADAAMLRLRVATHSAAIARIDKALKTAGQSSEPPEPAEGQPGGGQQAAAPVDLDSDPFGDRSAHEMALAASNSAVGLFDALAATLYADAAGMPTIERAAAEETLREMLKTKGRIATVKLDGAWGSHLAKHNFLSSLGKKLPVQVSATVGASWALFEFPSAKLLAADLTSARSALKPIDEII